MAVAELLMDFKVVIGILAPFILPRDGREKPVLSDVEGRWGRMHGFSFVLVIFTLSACAVAEAPRMSSVVQAGDTDPACAPLGITYTRTTMYFGLNHPTGMVSETEWQAFLSEDVTPRFPHGLTVLEADGQYRHTDGTIVRERSKILVIFHDQKPATREALETLVVRYKKTFAQESVLWESAHVCAAF